MSTRTIPLDCIDSLAQLRDELDVIWCALSNSENVEHCLPAIVEHINGVRGRFAAEIELMSGKAVTS
ncbi:hypothetical protein C5748_25735 [Phyllobacterium phragmitis]|uniref:Uncharacterized protein n=1 Tax=Phyllobacterium phragmitis TaxID=2670329 RepID=A0A2S9IJI0_9HYPH|nr:hypothetical protein [Phyllobacterium phragmitis]PRD40669.1 hypothetical protein C5748_25735 [Phyllobacterium phragmitis]